MTSPDGINWTARAPAADLGWIGVTWSPELSLFAAVAASGTGNRVMTSPDGINWTIRTSAADNYWRGIAWSPSLGMFAAVSSTGTGNRVMTSFMNTQGNIDYTTLTAHRFKVDDAAFVPIQFTDNGGTGLLEWRGSLDYFEFNDDILMNSSEKIYYRDLVIGIYSQADTFLDLFADGGVRIGDSSSGAPTNYTSIQPDGEIQLVGTARIKKHLILGVGKATPGASAPTSAVIGNYAVLQFSNIVTNSAYITFHMPDDWDSSTDMEAHIHWAPVNGNAGDVVWDLDYSSLASDNNEVISGAGTNLSVTDSTQSLQDELLLTDDVTIVKENLADADAVGIKLSRNTGDAADTYGAAASLIYLEVKYTANKLGEAT
jgi:hypothetical protein